MVIADYIWLNIMMKNVDVKPVLVGGFGEINFGKQYRQGNRVYSSEAIAMALNAQPVGNMGGFSYLYLVVNNDQTKI